MQNFSDRLKQAIAASGKQKGALAKHCGVEASTVTRWQTGTVPMADSILRIAEFLGVDAKWLMTGEIAEITKSSTNRKQPDVGNPAYVVREEMPAYRAEVDAVASAFAKIREGLDLLEQLMKNPPP